MEGRDEKSGRKPRSAGSGRRAKCTPRTWEEELATMDDRSIWCERVYSCSMIHWCNAVCMCASPNNHLKLAPPSPTRQTDSARAHRPLPRRPPHPPPSPQPNPIPTTSDSSYSSADSTTWRAASRRPASRARRRTLERQRGREGGPCRSGRRRRDDGGGSLGILWEVGR